MLIGCSCHLGKTHYIFRLIIGVNIKFILFYQHPANDICHRICSSENAFLNSSKDS